MKRMNIIDDHLFAYESNEKYYLKSSPNAVAEGYSISAESLATYAAMMNELMKKFNIITDFQVRFCSMDGYMIFSEVSAEDMAVMKLKGLELNECVDYLNEAIIDIIEWDAEEE